MTQGADGERLDPLEAFAKRAAAVGERTASRQNTGAGQADDLAAIGQDVRELAERLTEIARRDMADAPGVDGPPAARMLVASAAEQIRLRRSRDKLLPQLPVVDPAWDILLDLFIAHLEHRSVFVTSACLAAPVAMTTALRWLARLEALGLVARAADPADGRRITVGLTGLAAEAMTTWLSPIVRRSDAAPAFSTQDVVAMAASALAAGGTTADADAAPRPGR